MPVVYEIISFATKLQRSATTHSIKILLLADDAENPAREFAEQSGLDVSAIQIPQMTGYSGELYLQALSEVLSDMQPAFVCIAHTSQGQDYAPALAVKLGAACLTGITDCCNSAGDISFARPIYGEFGMRLEDCMYITDDGVELFSKQSPSINEPFA